MPVVPQPTPTIDPPSDVCQPWCECGWGHSTCTRKNTCLKALNTLLKAALQHMHTDGHFVGEAHTAQACTHTAGTCSWHNITASQGRSWFSRSLHSICMIQMKAAMGSSNAYHASNKQHTNKINHSPCLQCRLRQANPPPLQSMTQDADGPWKLEGGP